jgi:hypothetical protein
MKGNEFLRFWKKQNVSALDEDNLKNKISHSPDLSGLSGMKNYVIPQCAH